MSDNHTDYRIILPNDSIETGSIIDLEAEDCTPEPLKEQSLWRSVIIQAAYDAACAPTTPKARRAKTKAIMWFSMQDKDFLTVCELASVDPVSIVHGIKKYIKQSTLTNKRRAHMKRVRHKNVGLAKIMGLPDKEKIRR